MIRFGFSRVRAGSCMNIGVFSHGSQSGKKVIIIVMLILLNHHDNDGKRPVSYYKGKDRIVTTSNYINILHVSDRVNNCERFDG